MIVKHLINEVVKADLLDILHQIVIDFLSAHAIILGFVETRDRGDELPNLVTFQISVNNIVVRDIPDLRVTAHTPTHVIVNNVEHFMTYKEFDFLDLQEHNEATVVIEVQPVSCGC